MKKLLALIMILSIVFSATACGKTVTSNESQEVIGKNDAVSVDQSTTDNVNNDSSEENDAVNSEDIVLDISELNSEDLRFESDKFVDGDFIYLISEDNTYTKLVGYSGTDAEVIVPEKLGGKPVVSIGSNAFSGLKFIKSVVIEASLVQLLESAFSGCAGLQNISIKYVKEIKSSVFEDCTSLVNVSILNSEDCRVNSYSSIFQGCTSIDPTTLPECLLMEYLFIKVIDCFGDALDRSFEPGDVIMERIKSVVDEVITDGMFVYGKEVMLTENGDAIYDPELGKTVKYEGPSFYRIYGDLVLEDAISFLKDYYDAEIWSGSCLVGSHSYVIHVLVSDDYHSYLYDFTEPWAGEAWEIGATGYFDGNGIDSEIYEYGGRYASLLFIYE